MKADAAGVFSRAFGRLNGFSVIDVMAAVVVCLLIVVTALELLVSNNLTLSLHRQSGEAQDGGRYAADLITAQLRVAGSGRGSASMPPIVFNRQPMRSAQRGPAQPVFGSSDGGATGSDTLVVQYRVADWDARRAGDFGTDVKKDCTGQALPRGASVLERFYVGTDPATGAGDALLCSATTLLSTGPSQPVTVVLARNVDSFQVLYGVDGLHQSSKILRPTAYMTATQYVAAFPKAESPVVSVAFSLLVRSKASFRSNDRGYQVLDVHYAPGTLPDQGSVRRVYQATVRMRNAAPDGNHSLASGS